MGATRRRPWKVGRDLPAQAGIPAIKSPHGDPVRNCRSIPSERFGLVAKFTELPLELLATLSQGQETGTGPVKTVTNF